MSSSRSRSRSRGFRRAARRQEIEEASVLGRVAPADAGFWLPMLAEDLFGSAPNFGELWHARCLRRLSRLLEFLASDDEDLWAHFDRAQVLVVIVICVVFSFVFVLLVIVIVAFFFLSFVVSLGRDRRWYSTHDGGASRARWLGHRRFFVSLSNVFVLWA